MKKRICFLLSLLTVATTVVNAQKEVDASYRRSSISLLLMEDTDMPKRDVIKNAFLSAPIPEKYNDHNIDVRIFNSARMSISAADQAAYDQAVYVEGGKAKPAVSNDTKKAVGKGLGKLGRMAGGTAGALTSKAGETVAASTDRNEYAVKSYKYLMEQNVAKQLFDKWFIKDGEFNMDLIKERGLYDASALDVQKAKSSVRGLGILEDAGEELINNTFVIVSRFRYLSNDELAADIDANTRRLAAQLGGSNAAMASSAAIKAGLGAGYYVSITSFLFKLEWNDDIASKLYAELWDNMSAYDHSDIFSLQYVGEETAWAHVRASILTNKSEEELIDIATINATDAVLAKLEKKYDVFKTKTPILTTNPVTAAIGMKEGLEAGDKYEILEKNVDSKTGKTVYKRVGTVKVSDDQIWDNRFMAGEERELTGTVQNFTATKFDGGGKDLYPGLLLRQIK